MIPVRIALELKTRAVRGALAEIRLGADVSSLRAGVLLDTMVGPTPEAYLYEYAHPRPWLGQMVEEHLVDGVFGIPGRESSLPRQAFAIEIGEPFPLTGDTVEIAYAWCIRRFPVRPGAAGPASAWRDAFIPADSGWARVRHTRVIAPTACTP